MPGFSQNSVYADNVAFDGGKAPTVLADGQLLIGAAVAPKIRVNTLTAGAGVTITNGAGTITIGLTGGGAAVEHLTGTTGGQLNPSGNNFNLLAGTVAAGTTPVAINGSGSTLTTNIQRSQALAAADSTKVGLSNFSSADFSVAATGFVTLSTTGAGKTITGDTGGALSPTANNWNILSTATNGIETTGSGSTLTIAMATPYADGDFEFRSSVSGATRVLSVTNTSNTASSQSQMTHSVAGTTAGDTWSQYTVGTTRTYAQGIDNSDSQKLKLTTAAGATANPSTATPVWAFTPATGYNYDVSGTSGFGIGLGIDPDTNYAVKMFKSADATFGMQIQNTSSGTSASAVVNFINNTPIGASISVPSSAFSEPAVRDKLFLNAGAGSLGIAYSVPVGASHNFYATVAAGNLIFSATNTNVTFSRPVVIGTQEIFSTRQTAPSAGTIGELLSASNTTGTVLSNGATTNITSVTLTAGIWDITANFANIPTGTMTLILDNIAAISAANNNLTAVDNFGSGIGLGVIAIPNLTPTSAHNLSLNLGPCRVSISGNTTYYLNAACTGTTVNTKGYGAIRAVRVA